MGRGRAKAKQVKVARQLKYNSGGTDLDRLRTELGVGRDDDDAHGDSHAGTAGRYTDDADDEDDEEDEDAEDEEDVGADGASHMSTSERW
ncbi:MAG TPA: DUF3073 domain-containing protein [Streptosporangiaceae bacterium]|jgi:hypothetical protein|nr:DUF3073 domain-containing protein [Streptosporangiaceae bacterium]